MNASSIWRKLHAVSFQLRQARVVAKAMKSPHHPIVAHIVPIRRCNLACTYCNEFDDLTKPVPLVTMFRRIDRLAELGTTVITISGGEPLLHPEPVPHDPHVVRVFCPSSSTIPPVTFASSQLPTPALRSPT